MSPTVERSPGVLQVHSSNVQPKPISHRNQKLTQQHNPPDRRLELFFSGRNKTFPPQQKNWHNRTTELYTKYVRNTKKYIPPESKN
jgi:hypothetical protein